MTKFKLIIWNISNCIDQQIAGTLQLDHVVILNQLNGIGTAEEIQSLVQTAGWDYIVVLVQEDSDIIFNILNDLGVERTRVLFPQAPVTWEYLCQLDSFDYIFRGSLVEWINFFRIGRMGDYLTATTSDSISYLSESCDRSIMGFMFTSHDNWAKDEIRLFLN